MNLQTFKKNARSVKSDLSLNALYPMPAELVGTDGLDERPNWRSWRYENWGTKWDAAGKLVAEFEDSLEYSFRTAWNPPIEWLEKVSKDYPELQFTLRYVEESDDFTGIAKAKRGRVNDHRLELNDGDDGKSLMESLSDLPDIVVEACAKMTHRVWSLLPEGR